MANGTYQINFNTNGGSPSQSSLSGTTTGHVDELGTWHYSANVKLPSSKPSKQYYTFQSWGGYAAGATFKINTTNASYSTTLTAQYTRNKITVSYNSNGGSAVASQTVNQYEWFNLTTTVPTKTGYTFQGWEYGGNVYASGSQARLVASVTFTAVWQAITYNVQFNANGGTGAPSAQTKTYGQTLTLSSTVPTRTNYTFLGWSTSNTATQPTYTAGGSYTANASATLYAVWELAIRTLTLSFNANGGSNPPSSLSVQTAESAYSFQVPQQVVDTPYYDHHVFLGWSTEEDGSVEYAYPMSITIQNNTTLYAVWRLETFTISFNANGGSNPPASITKTYGQGIFLPLIAPVRDGYNFLGWDTSSAGNVVVYEAGDLYEEEESVVLYAVWQIKTYTVAYNANGGSDAPASQTKTHNVSVVLSSARPIRASYVFTGWGTSADATTPSYQPSSPYTVNADVTLYAIWKEATYDSADLFVNGEPCEVFIKLKDDVFDPTLYQGGSYNPAIGTQWTLSESSTQLTKDGDDYYISLGSWSARVLLFKVDVGETYHITAEFSGDNIATTRGFLSSSYEVMTNFNETGANVSIDLTITPTTGQAYFYILFAPRSTEQTITIANPAAIPSVTIVGADVIMI